MLVLHVHIRCSSLSITTPLTFLATEFHVQSVLHGQVSLAAVNQMYVIHESMNGCFTLYTSFLLPWKPEFRTNQYNNIFQSLIYLLKCLHKMSWFVSYHIMSLLIVIYRPALELINYWTWLFKENKIPLTQQTTQYQNRQTNELAFHSVAVITNMQMLLGRVAFIGYYLVLIFEPAVWDRNMSWYAM